MLSVGVRARARVRVLSEQIDQLLEAEEPTDAIIACLFSCALRARPLSQRERAEVQRALLVVDATIGGGPGPVAVSAIPS